MEPKKLIHLLIFSSVLSFLVEPICVAGTVSNDVAPVPAPAVSDVSSPSRDSPSFDIPLPAVPDPHLALKRAIRALRKGFESATAAAVKISKNPSTTKVVKSCLEVCLELFDAGIAELRDALAAIASRDIDKLNVLLSASITYVSTCEDSFVESGVESPIKEISQKLGKLGSNALAISTKIHF